MGARAQFTNLYIKQPLQIGQQLTLVVYAAPGNPGYYVATAGNDANAGTLASPWRHVGYALTNSAPGGTIYLNGGDVFAEQNLQFIHSNTLTSYGTGKGWIYVTNGEGILVSNLSGCHITGIGINGTNYDCGAFFSETTPGVVYSNDSIAFCEITNAGQNAREQLSLQQGGQCVVDECGTSGADTGFVCNSNLLHDSFCDGIQLWADGSTATLQHFNPTINGNVITNIFGNGFTNVGNAFVNGVGIAPGMCSNLTLAFNVIHDLGAQSANPSGGGPGGIVVVYSDLGDCFSNDVSHVSANAAHVDGVNFDSDIGARRIHWHSNFSHDSRFGFYDYFSWGSNVLDFNVSLNDTNGVSAFGLSSNLFIFNNTFFDRGPALNLSGSTNAAFALVANNILSGAATGSAQLVSSGFTNLILAANDYTRPRDNWMWVTIGGTDYHTVTDLQTAGYETNGTGTNVLPWAYAPAYSIKTNATPYNDSPLIDAGQAFIRLNVTAPAFDALGNLVGTAANIGAINTNLAFAPSSLVTNCVADFPFTEGSGTSAFDYSGYQYQGTLSGGASFTNLIGGGGIALDGSSGSVNLGVLSNAMPVTISYWSFGGGASGSQTALDAWDSGSYSQLAYGNQMIADVGGGDKWSNNIAIPASQLVNVVLRVTTNSFTIWTNGVLANVGQHYFNTTPESLSTTIVLGETVGGTKYYSGAMGHFTLWQRALSTNSGNNEILEYYTNLLAGGQYPFK
ncbi:MAG: hypothetical protein KGL39_49070 [Patescibacteria group bacterium]|nr:hypothetical protein [Patescibacteria group bacterium]